MVTSGSALFDTAARLFKDLFPPSVLSRAESGAWLAPEWQKLEDLGLTGALIPEAAGGYGADPIEALELVRIAGSHALPLPLAETMMASWLLASCGGAVPHGPLTACSALGFPVILERRGAGWRLEGRIARVPWGEQAAALVLVAESEGKPFAVLLRKGEWQTARGANLACEPRDDLSFGIDLDAGAVRELPPLIGPEKVPLLGAAMRTLAIAGALEKVLSITIDYANERVQFGRPIGKFQAVQHNLAVLAGHAAAASGAAGLAAEAVANGLAALPISAAKVRASEAAGAGAAIAHQIHGAIGFAREHQLHFYTKRLWSWRDEYGNESAWSLLAGREAICAGSEGLWPLVAAV